MKNKLVFKIFISFITIYISSALLFVKIGNYMFVNNDVNWWDISTQIQNEIWGSKMITLFAFPSLFALTVFALVTGTFLVKKQLFNKVKPLN
ncbi:hypothetical protein P4H08_18930 [Bacillus cereus]|nr:hypothetical protein [Bacillus cereus]